MLKLRGAQQLGVTGLHRSKVSVWMPITCRMAFLEGEPSAPDPPWNARSTVTRHGQAGDASDRDPSGTGGDSALKAARQILHLVRPVGAGNGDRPALTAHEGVWGQAFQSLSEGVLVLDRAGAVVSVNPAACAVLERTETELRVPNSLTDLDARTEAGVAIRGHQSFGARVLATGETVRELTISIARRDRSRRWLTVSYQPLTSTQDGTVDGLVLSMREVTQQREDHQKLCADLEEARTLARIYEALAHDRLVLYSQPIVRLCSGECTREELLVRMIGADGAVIAPAAFLPVAERHDAIVEIDRWVLTQAVALAADGRRLAVNLSARSLGDSRVLDTLQRSLKHSNINPAQLMIEITETALSEDHDTVAQFADQLVALGCGFALDDFGTGSGTLSYLKRLPVSVIKIDREFVADLLTSPSSAKIIAAITIIAAEFGLHTIAEGVENRPTLDALRTIGVELAQGFHLGRPTPAARPAPDGRPLLRVERPRPSA